MNKRMVTVIATIVSVVVCTVDRLIFPAPLAAPQVQGDTRPG